MNDWFDALRRQVSQLTYSELIELRAVAFGEVRAVRPEGSALRVFWLLLHAAVQARLVELHAPLSEDGDVFTAVDQAWLDNL